MLSCGYSSGETTEEVGIANRPIRVNKAIRADNVRVIDEQGNQLGVLPLEQALQEARQRGLDLVLIAPQAIPPVCKILDYGKYKYQLEKKERKKQKTQKLKEMRFTSKIDEHDLATKVRHIRRFLENENKVKITVIFRGREIVHMDRGRELLKRLVQAVEDVAKVDYGPKVQGRTLQMLLIPTGGIKENEHGAKQNEKPSRTR